MSTISEEALTGVRFARFAHPVHLPTLSTSGGRGRIVG
jgi:hypothetical protein